MSTEPSGMNRRQLLRHNAWFGAAVVLTVTGGEVISHIGTTDVTGSFSRAIDQVNGLGFRPDFVMHTGDLTHLSTPVQFDQVHQMLGGLRTGGVFTVPGEHDSVDDHGQKYRAIFGAGTRVDGWYSFDVKGVHVIALVNTLALESSATSAPTSSSSSARTWRACHPGTGQLGAALGIRDVTYQPGQHALAVRDRRLS